MPPIVSDQLSEVRLSGGVMPTCRQAANCGCITVLGTMSLPTATPPQPMFHRRADEAGEQRMRPGRLRFELGMILHADEPRMVGQSR